MNSRLKFMRYEQHLKPVGVFIHLTTVYIYMQFIYENDVKCYPVCVSGCCCCALYFCTKDDIMLPVTSGKHQNKTKKTKQKKTSEVTSRPFLLLAL